MLSKTKEKNKQKILDCSYQLFLDNGISETSISDISKSANLDRKTIYNYFKNKEDIAHHIFKHVLRDIAFPQWKREDDLSGYELFSKLLFITFDYVLINENFNKYMSHYEYSFPDQELFLNSRNLEELRSGILYRSLLQGINDKSIDIGGKKPHKFLATLFIPLLSGVQKYYLRKTVLNNNFDIELNDIRDNMIYILNGIKAK